MKLFFKLLLLIVMILNLQACDKCQDGPIVFFDLSGSSLIDSNEVSPYFGNYVAPFLFTQNKITYVVDNCGTDLSEITLEIHNTTSTKITFDYTINSFNKVTGNLIWTYQNFATIPGFGTKLDVGLISTNPELLRASNIVVYSKNIKYE